MYHPRLSGHAVTLSDHAETYMHEVDLDPVPGQYKCSSFYASGAHAQASSVLSVCMCLSRLLQLLRDQ